MSKDKAKVRRFELGKPPPDDAKEDIEAVGIPVRSQYSSAETSKKQRHVHLSYSAEDPFFQTPEVANAISSFIESTRAHGDVVTTTHDESTGVAGAKRHILIVTKSYFESSECQKELAVIRKHWRLQQRVIVIFEESLFEEVVCEKMPEIAAEKSADIWKSIPFDKANFSSQLLEAYGD